MIGTTIGHYRIEEKLGEGGMSQNGPRASASGCHFEPARRTHVGEAGGDPAVFWRGLPYGVVRLLERLSGTIRSSPNSARAGWESSIKPPTPSSTARSLSSSSPPTFQERKRKGTFRPGGAGRGIAEPCEYLYHPRHRRSR